MTRRPDLTHAAPADAVEQLEQRAIDELSVDPAQLVEEFGPHLPVPLFGPVGDAAREAALSAAAEAGEALAEDYTPTEPFVREAQEKRLRQAERAMNQLGRVNPLALEERNNFV